MDLSDYIDQVTACDDVPELKRLLVQAFDDFEAKAISGFEFPFGGAVASGGQLPILTTYPEHISHAYREKMSEDDPVMYAAMTLGQPIQFLKIEQSLHITERSATVIQMMRDAGLRDAVSTPVFARPGVYGYFSVAFGRPRDDLTKADLRRIKIFFSEFFVRYCELTRVRENLLSQREREVLVGIINDRSNAQIAASLGVSENTVETYIRRAFAKLDVNSRTQAVLRYLGGGAMGVKAAT